MSQRTRSGAGRIALFDNIKGLLIILVVVFKCVFIVQQQTEFIIERFGKFVIF